MTNEQFIERLKLKDWYVTCQNKQESNLVLQACDDAGITWAAGQKATEWCPFETYPLEIGFYKDSDCITFYNLYEKEEVENITDWFFSSAKG